ncbi:MAG TPA: hypothetical protein PKW35_04420 [Nannocystaceae bacterium]|nr:hypothetical protein [Nannocystaceae bacterium]
MTQLGLLQRSVVSALRLMTKVAAGYDMGPIQEEMVRIHGVRGALRLMKMGAEITERLHKTLGDSTAQFLIGIAALWNGCRYCVIGHIYSANLFLFRDKKRLGPLDEDELVDLMYMTDQESFAVIRERFSAPEDEQLLRLVTRLFHLRFQDLDPVEPEDELLKATLAYWEWLNECTIILGVDATPTNVPALGFMRPTQQLLESYANARAASRASAPRVPRRS